MIGNLGALARRALLALPPETAYRVAMAGLKLMPEWPRTRRPDDELAVSAFGLDFPNPVGLAAGFDKNAEAPRGLTGLGFGFVELGTATPRPQAGNPEPRLFRLTRDAAIINRMGFNNDGYEAIRARLARKRPRGIVGVNFGPNKDSTDRIADFTLGVKTFASLADYLTINVSSPNTVGLRDLQRRDALDELIARVVDAREAAPERPPLLIKIAPELDLRALDDVCAVAIARGIDGLIIGNTTVARPATLVSPEAGEAGGLSGRPLFSASTQLLARAFLRCEGALRLIGCGGVENAETALAKIEAGADLVQLYTAFVYRGPGVIGEILAGLREATRAYGLGAISALVGLRAREYAAQRARREP